MRHYYHQKEGINMEYVPRIVDKEIDRKKEAFNAMSIVGPKGCGKTRTAKERCSTVIEFQDEEKRAGYLSVAETSPRLFLKNRKPILFDEWQDAPKIWGTIRKACDDNPEATGEYYLTGSTSRKVHTPHSGTGRITEITMYPMSLYETGESTGAISLHALFDNPDLDINGTASALELEDLFFAVCRGGWPRCLALKSADAKLEIAKDYFNQIYRKDISTVDGVERNPEWAKTILWSYARNMATLAKKSVIYTDVKANHNISDATISSYVEALEKLFVLKEIDAWTPQVRSKTAIRAARKHIFIDPSIGIAALGLNPDYFNNDLDTFGHVFENMVLRDLLVFSAAHNAKVMHYSDDYGLEADAVYQLDDGRYALIEIKTGSGAIPAAEKNLLRFSDVIRRHNEKAMANTDHPGVMFREPSLLIVICANCDMAYTTENGVLVIPVGCLKD